jgi:SAM-dependent methyltransferase
MRFPVCFMSIEEELRPSLMHLRGRVLNAGCGDRNISDLLIGAGAQSVDNCDIQSSIPGAFICDLREIPRPDSCYDAILCNAVLEHVPDAEKVMSEFRRLLAPGGKLVVAVPFLQPYHPTPLDLRRYTLDGLIDLCKRFGFDVVHTAPVHSMAQTLGWMYWAYLEERKSTTLKVLFWLPIYVASRLWKAPRPESRAACSGFQVVGVKP